MVDPFGILLVGFGFYKLIQLITKEDEVVEDESADIEKKASSSAQQIGPKEIPYNY